MDRHLVSEIREFYRQPLDAFDQEDRILQTRSLRPPGAGREGIRARVDGDREGRRLAARTVEDVATVTRTYIYKDVPERGGD